MQGTTSLSRAAAVAGLLAVGSLAGGTKAEAG
jgi:hypothetical protein